MVTERVEVASFPFCLLFFSFQIFESSGMWTQICLSKISRDLIFGALKIKIMKKGRRAWKFGLWKDYSDQLPESRNKIQNVSRPFWIKLSYATIHK